MVKFDEVGGYLYAKNIDKYPSDYSRKRAIEEGDGLLYAIDVDKMPRIDTRLASYKNFDLEYMIDVDKVPRADTRGLMSEHDQWHFTGFISMFFRRKHS